MFLGIVHRLCAFLPVILKLIDSSSVTDKTKPRVTIFIIYSAASEDSVQTFFYIIRRDSLLDLQFKVVSEPLDLRNENLNKHLVCLLFHEERLP